MLGAGKKGRGVRPFRFMVNWLADKSFKRVVEEAWAKKESWGMAVEDFQKRASEWNSQEFGNIFHGKRRLMARIEGVDRKLGIRDCQGLRKLRLKLWKEYQDILFHEDVYWYQRARQDWVKFGDRNTRFFHLSVVIRRKRNATTTLTNEQGAVITDEEDMKAMTVQYFRNLYTANEALTPWPLREGFPSLSSHELEHVQADPTDAEIKEAIFAMGAFKAPGPDALHPIFYQSNWEIVGKVVCRVVKQAFHDPNSIADINGTLLVLIPKVEAPEKLSQYRPINLCNVVYKIITKIMATRLRQYMNALVAPNQCSFIPGRHNSDNIIVAQEVFHSMRYVKGKVGMMAVKVGGNSLVTL